MNEKRTFCIEMEAHIPANELLAPYVATALRDYVTAITAGEAGNSDQEFFRSSNGVEITATHTSEAGSPMTTDTAIEAEIQAKGLTAPRVTPADLEANISHTEIVKHVSPSGQVLRWAVITTRNGFAVAGRPSASASPENDNQEIGERIAVENAKSELWPLMGYQLRTQLAGG